MDPRACAQQRFSFYSIVISYKQRPCTLSTLISFSLWMCDIANDERRSSVVEFLEWFNQSGVFITKSWLRTRKMLKIETTAQNFKIFFSLQVRTCVYTYRTLRACQWPVTSDQWLVPSDQWPVTSDQWPVTSYQLFRPAGLETEVTKGFLVSLQLLCLRWTFKREETVTLTRVWTRTARRGVQHAKIGPLHHVMDTPTFATTV